MGNKVAKKRLIRVNNPLRRLSKQEKQQLKEAFDRLQEAQTINEFQFRLEVLGPQVPESIGIKVFQLFTSMDIVQDQMTFEDLVSCYVLFKHGKSDEIGQVVFEMFKLITNCDLIKKEQFTIFAERIGCTGNQKITPGLKINELEFYLATKFDPRLPINKEEFARVYKKVESFPLFQWVPQLVTGYQKNYMNIEESKSDMTKSETEEMGFNSQEYENMQQFFNQEIKKNDAKEVLKTLQRLLSGIKNDKLKKYFIEVLTKHVINPLNLLIGKKALDFKYLTNLVFFISKQQSEEQKLDYLFQLFSAPADFMRKKQMRDFAEIFDIGINFFNARGGSMNKQEFIDDCSNLKIDFSIYEKTKYVMMAMLGLKPISEEEERESILASLDNNHKVENYIYDNLVEEDTFYVIDKDFWDSWSIQVAFNDDKTITFKKEKEKTINNLQLIEPGHQLRLKNVSYNEDFIIVPKYVFNALSKWYSCNKIIERKVISYKQQKSKSLSLFKNKKAASSMVISQQLPEQFFRNYNDLMYELEIYPKLVYYEKINEKGERPHNKAIVNQKVDQNYMKKVLKSDKIPFYELCISRKTTFEEILRIISLTFKENPKKGRLWIEDHIISGAKLGVTLEDFGISIGQVIYAEYANNNNIWPTDKITASASRPEEKKDIMLTSGLYNLGNTCYMNSALQCLANTKFFYDYFVKEKKYLTQMNLKSKFGFQGELAQNFAILMDKLWANPFGAVIPRQFKQAVSNIGEQFQGYDQQDSQEFLSFLLDGLHEELNLRQDKPYIQNPDSDNRKIVELGLEQWSNSLRREWSFIFFMFFGQLKSTLNCKVCNKVSTTFDVFTNIPLSLPEPSKVLINVIIYRLPNEVKDLLSGQNNVVLRRNDTARSDEGRGMSQNAERDPANIVKFQESFKYMTNDQPIHICIRVDKDIKIGALIEQIAEVREVNINAKSQASQLVLYSTIKGSIRGIFNPDLKLTQYNLLTNEIDAIEILTKKGRETIKQFYNENPQFIESCPDTHLQCLTSNSEKLEIKAPNPQKRNAQRNTGGRSDRSTKDETYGVKIDKCNLFNNYQVAYDKFTEFDENGNFPEEIYAVAYHRRFIKKNYYFFQPYQPQLLSNPMIITLPLKPTGKRVYQEVWAIAQSILKKTSIFHHKRYLWWEQKDWQEKLSSNDFTQAFKPFVLKTVERSGYSCSECNWMQKCSGCILPPTDEYIEDFFKKCHLAIEWNSSVIEDDYNQGANEVLQHFSTTDKNLLEEDLVNLEDCLRKFHEVEDLGSQDNIHCGNCKQHQEHFKKLEIFRPPPILIIQLKRFKFSSTHRNKLMTLVEFPLYNLDLASFVTDQDFLKAQGIEQTYDLYAMINHYGNLHFGHYISVIKNNNDGKWYKYDDSFRNPIPEDQIQKDDAYILFYARKDIHLKSLDKILPNIKDLFPGKPIKTERGDEFVVEQKSNDNYIIQDIQSHSTKEVSKDYVEEEKDSNEIHYDQKEMQEIENKKKEKQNEQIKKYKKQKCRICITFLFGETKASKKEDKKKSYFSPNKKRHSIKANMNCNVF